MTKKLIELITIAEQDMVLDKSKLDSESLRTPQLHNKWLKLLYERKDVLFALELKKKNIYKRLWLYYNGKSPDSVYEEKGSFDLRIMKADIPFFIESDKEMQEVDIKIHALKQEIEFCVKTLEELNRRTFVIGNALKAISFMNGLN